MLPQSTLYAVAQMASVSLEEVINVVLEQNIVSDDIRSRVLTAMKLHESFRGNAAVQVMQHRIAAIVPGQIIDDYMGTIVQGATAAAKANGYDLLIHVQNPNREDDIELLMRDANIDGVIAVVPVGFEDVAGIFSDGSRPYVFVDYRGDVPVDGALIIEAENRLSIINVMRYLFELGHTRIGFITGKPTYASARQRLEGYQAALDEAGIPYDERLIVEGSWEHQSGYTQTKQLLSLADHPTAIVASNDFTAFGAIQAATELGFVVGENMSITGFDDINMAAVVSPSLTTVRQPTRLMGSLAVEMLIKRLNGEPIEEPHVRLPTELIIRNSTGKATSPTSVS